MAGIKQLVEGEPVRIVLYLNAALTATVQVLALIFEWDDTIETAVTALLVTWMLVTVELLRDRVTPVTTDS